MRKLAIVRPQSPAVRRHVCHGWAVSPTVQDLERRTVERNSTVAHVASRAGLALVLAISSSAVAWDLKPLPSPASVAGNLVADASFEQSGWETTGGGIVGEGCADGESRGPHRTQ